MGTKRDDTSALYTLAADAAERIAVRADDFALDQLQALRALIEHELIPATVDARRRKGQTWEQIGRDLGLTRQGAQQRFGSSEVGALELTAQRAQQLGLEIAERRWKSPLSGLGNSERR